MSTLVIAPSFANQMYIFCMYPNASRLQKLTTRFAGLRYKVKRWNRGIYRSVNLGHLKMDLCSDLFPKVWKKDEWPGNSPDMNPIEKLWSIMKEKIFETPYCKTITQLEERIRRVWKSLDMNKDLLASLVDDNWTKRVSQVIDHQGEINFK